MSKRYRVEAIRQVEVYQWLDAESPEEAIRIAKSEEGGVWEIDHEHEPGSFEVTEEEEEDKRVITIVNKTPGFIEVTLAEEVKE
jgi:hypothetical protein